MSPSSELSESGRGSHSRQQRAGAERRDGHGARAGHGAHVLSGGGAARWRARRGAARGARDAHARVRRAGGENRAAPAVRLQRRAARCVVVRRCRRSSPAPLRPRLPSLPQRTAASRPGFWVSHRGAAARRRASGRAARSRSERTPASGACAQVRLTLGLRRLPLSRLLSAAPAGQRSAPRFCVVCAVARARACAPWPFAHNRRHSIPPSGPAPANEAALQNIVFKYVTCAQDIRCVLWRARAFPLCRPPWRTPGRMAYCTLAFRQRCCLCLLPPLPPSPSPCPAC